MLPQASESAANVALRERLPQQNGMAPLLATVQALAQRSMVRQLPAELRPLLAQLEQAMRTPGRPHHRRRPARGHQPQRPVSRIQPRPGRSSSPPVPAKKTGKPSCCKLSALLDSYAPPRSSGTQSQWRRLRRHRRRRCSTAACRPSRGWPRRQRPTSPRWPRGRCRPAARPVAWRRARRAGPRRSGAARSQPTCRHGSWRFRSRAAMATTYCNCRWNTATTPTTARASGRSALPSTCPPSGPVQGELQLQRPAPVRAPVGRTPRHRRSARTDLRRAAPPPGRMRPAAGPAHLPDRRAAVQRPAQRQPAQGHRMSDFLPSPATTRHPQAQRRRRHAGAAPCNCHPKP